MRLALNNALQSYSGTVILVSHDRHLLRTVCDDLLLVDSGRVVSFNQGVDDYPRWLIERKKQSNPADNLMENAQSTVRPESQLDKKEKKKREAELRKVTQPLMQRQKRLERAIEKIQNDQNNIEMQLSDTQLYDDSQKEKLKDILFTQADHKKQIEELEMEWFQISEEIDSIRE